MIKWYINWNAVLYDIDRQMPLLIMKKYIRGLIKSIIWTKISECLHAQDLDENVQRRATLTFIEGETHDLIYKPHISCINLVKVSWDERGESILVFWLF